MRRPLRIGLVFSYSLAYCRGILRGIKAYARAKQDWIFAPVDPDAGGIRLLRDLEPAGIIAHIYTDAVARDLRQSRKPLVNVCGVIPDLPVPRVGLDDLAIGRLAANHLLDRGLRQFAFIGHPNHGYSVRREAGFRQAIEQAGFGVLGYSQPVARFNPRGRLWALDERICRWITELPKPVGIFACNDVWGVQISEICRQVTLHVPEEVAIVGVDNDDLLCELARPSLSSVAVPAETVGYEAAALLDRLMSRQAKPKGPILLPPIGVVTRQSSDILAVTDADVAAAIRFVREHAHEPIRIEDILLAVPVSRRSLERRFRKVLSRGISEEIRRVHMEHAKNLLARTDLSMPDVARSSGFTDGKHLSVVFHQEAGLTPTAYRRQFRASLQ